MTRPKSKIGAMFEPATHRLLGYALTYRATQKIIKFCQDKEYYNERSI